MSKRTMEVEGQRPERSLYLPKVQMPESGPCPRSLVLQGPPLFRFPNDASYRGCCWLSASRICWRERRLTARSRGFDPKPLISESVAVSYYNTQGKPAREEGNRLGGGRGGSERGRREKCPRSSQSLGASPSQGLLHLNPTLRCAASRRL